MSRPSPFARRALALLLFGAAYLIYGIQMLLAPHPLPGPWWLPGTLFCSGGLVALAALTHRTIRSEWLAFTWLYTVAGLVSLAHVAAWVVGTGHTRPLSDGMAWALVAGLVALVGGWAEPCPPSVVAEVHEARRRAAP